MWLTINGNEFTGKVHSVDAAKGTARYEEPWPCRRCGGQGGAEQWKYTGWTCYECGGHGFRGRTRARKLYAPEAYAKLEAIRAKRQAKQAAKQAAAAAKRAEAVAATRKIFEAENPGLRDKLVANASSSEFLADLLEKLDAYGSLTEGQVAAVDKTMARIEEKAKAADCPTGRVKVTGVVLKVETRTVAVGYSVQTVYKMAVKSMEGWVVWCTVPAGLKAEKDATVIFSATLEPSPNDPKFGFGKRPACVKQ
jgi:Flp pilus assembly protein TadG